MMLGILPVLVFFSYCSLVVLERFKHKMPKFYSWFLFLPGFLVVFIGSMLLLEWCWYLFFSPMGLIGYPTLLKFFVGH